MEAVVAIKMKPRELDIVRQSLVSSQMSFAKQGKARKSSPAARVQAKKQAAEIAELLEVLGPPRQSVVGFGVAA